MQFPAWKSLKALKMLTKNEIFLLEIIIIGFKRIVRLFKLIPKLIPIRKSVRIASLKRKRNT